MVFKLDQTLSHERVLCSLAIQQNPTHQKKLSTYVQFSKSIKHWVIKQSGTDVRKIPMEQHWTFKFQTLDDMCVNYWSSVKVVKVMKGLAQWGVGEETRSRTEKRCSHNLQSGHPAWWSVDNYGIFPTVNILEARIEANRQRKSEMLKKLKKIISCNFVFLAYHICLSVLKCGGN